MKKIALVIVFFLVATVSAKTINAQGNGSEYVEETLEGRVVQVLEVKEFSANGILQHYQKLRALVTKGSLKNQTIEIENSTLITSNNQKYKAGDGIVILYSKDINGEDLFIITDYIRRKYLLYLFLIFAALVVLVGKFLGASSLLGMVFSFFIIFKYILPQIISGKDPVLVAILGSLMIIPVSFTLSHGLKPKTLIAVTGTVITLIITGLISRYFISLSHLTGYSSEEANFLQFEVNNILNMQGIILAGIIVATLGILDDITISQASIVNELKKANKKYSFIVLYKKAMVVGRDHISSLVNTLILVYAGASLPLLLLFINNPRPFSEVINYEIIAVEIIKTLVGSIGIILAVPITTLIAAYYFQHLRKG